MDGKVEGLQYLGALLDERRHRSDVRRDTEIVQQFTGQGFILHVQQNAQQRFHVQLSFPRKIPFRVADEQRGIFDDLPD